MEIFFRKYDRNTRGISLLETVLTMIVISVAVSAVMPVSKIYVAKAREEALKTELTNIREAISKYRADTGNYPRSIDVLLQNRYLRRLEDEPFGFKWEYRAASGEHTWKRLKEEHRPEQKHLHRGRSRAAQNGDRIFDIRSSCEYTGLNGVVYTAW